VYAFIVCGVVLVVINVTTNTHRVKIFCIFMCTETAFLPLSHWTSCYFIVTLAMAKAVPSC